MDNGVLFAVRDQLQNGDLIIIFLQAVTLAMLIIHWRK